MTEVSNNPEKVKIKKLKIIKKKSFKLRDSLKQVSEGCIPTFSLSFLCILDVSGVFSTFVLQMEVRMENEAVGRRISQIHLIQSK